MFKNFLGHGIILFTFTIRASSIAIIRKSDDVDDGKMYPLYQVFFSSPHNKSSTFGLKNKYFYLLQLSVLM